MYCFLGDSNPSLSNPPTPKNDLTTPMEAKKIDDEMLNGKINGKTTKNGGTLSIKNFFRVSKTPVPSQQQKIVVQMMEISENNTSLRNSLRSTRSNPKNDEPKNDVKEQNHENHENDEKLVEFETKNDENIESKNESPQTTSVFLPLSVSTPQVKSLNEPQLISPSSNASLTSPTLSNSNVPKKKKKLNDCIAMLTCKIQEKLGVNFFNEPLKNEDEENIIQDEITPEIVIEKPQEISSDNIIKPKAPSTSFQIASLLGESLNDSGQNEVIDLSVKKSFVELNEPSVTKVEELSKESTNKSHEISVAEVEKVETKTLEQQETQVPIMEKSNDEMLNKAEEEIKVEEELNVIVENELNENIKSEMENVTTNEQIENIENIVETVENEVENISIIQRPVRKVKAPPKKKIVRKQPVKKGKKVPPKVVEIVEETDEIKEPTIEVIEEKPKEIEIEDFRISISKRKIPNLKHILEMKNSQEIQKKAQESIVKEEIQPTVKINNCSLNISDEERRAFEEQKNRIMQILNKSKQNNKTPKKKIPSPKKTPIVKKKQKSETISITPEIKEVTKEDENIQEKIEMTIKATNRVRCRRLSVVIDPIIQLSNFQNKNRKIRLTNNSQQNGLYDMFTSNDDNLFSNTKIDEKPKNDTKEVETENVVLTEPPVIDNKSQQQQNHVDELQQKPKVKKNVKANRTSLKKIEIEEEIIKPTTPEPILVEDVLKPRAAKSQAIGLITSDKPKQSPKKPKTPKISAIKLKKISMENSFISDETLNEQSEEMKFDEKPATPGIVEKDEESEKIQIPLEEVKIEENKEVKISPKKQPVKKKIFKGKKNDKKSEPIEINNTSNLENNLELKIEEKLNEKEEPSFNPFTINEDSLFNDDDNDPTDKINDIVNNIINSTEFQIDSETEKSESNATSFDDNKNQNSPVCIICRRSFRNEKVYEKHCKTSTHIMKLKRRKRGSSKQTMKSFEKAPSPIIDEMKIFRTKGALKTFDVHEIDTCEQQKTQNFDDKLFFDMKMEKKPEDMTPKDKDQLFDSLFNSLEANALSRRKTVAQDSEIESSSTSWDLKHDADIEWDGTNNDNIQFPNNSVNTKKVPVKNNKTKDTAVSIPTKSLIMGKIFKKHRDREKQKTPQADAPTNKTGIKNSLDEIFDHLKNTSEIDDRVLTCPSPKTLLRVSGGTFSPNSSNSNDMLESASQSNNNNNNNNNIYKSKTPEKSIPEEKKVKASSKQTSKESSSGDGIVKRMPRRRCAAKTKTFAETWSSDEYEELHDTEDIISIINEIERRESIKKNKQQTSLPQKSSMCEVKVDKKLQFVEEVTNEKKLLVEGYKSEEEAFTSSKEILPSKPVGSYKKRRMSCFVPSMKSTFEKETIAPTIMKIEKEVLAKFDKVNESLIPEIKVKNAIKKTESEKSLKGKNKSQKQRKKPKNRIKNIAYDTDSDFELNLSKKPKTKQLSECMSSDDDDNDNESVITTKTTKSISSQHMTVLKESTKLLPNDLKPMVTEIITSSNHKAAIPEDITESDIKACSRTKRHSSEKLYYWSSSSDSDDDKVQQGDVADINNEEPATPHQQPEQHGWIVGDSHKKLVTLLAHAKIKNKVN